MATEYLGQPIRRVEDLRFLQGKGRYVSDIEIPGLLDIAFVRSIYAHARIVGVRAASAEAISGVITVLSGLSDEAGKLDEKARKAGSIFSLLANKIVHYVGEPVALVAAQSRHMAEDGCDAVEVDYEPLPVLASIEAAMAE